MKHSKLKELKRFEEVAAVLAKHEWKQLFSKKKNREEKPEMVKNIVEELGGTFIKLGQVLSLRPDLIPQPYCNELSKLQDQVKPFSYKEAEKILTKNLGAKPKKYFKKFNKKPLASASIGQVHEATLITGEKVAVKIRRPRITEIMETDLEILEWIAEMAKKYANPKVFDPKDMIQELRQYTEEEMNFLKEAQKIAKFYELMKQQPVKIPVPHIKMCSEEVLVMEFIEGQKLNEFMEKTKDKEKRRITSQKILDLFMTQIFEKGYFHADPHPGNILILEPAKNNGKEIAFLDFGITGEINDEMREGLGMLFVSLIKKDLEGITESMVKLHLVQKEQDSLKGDLRSLLGPYYGASINHINVSKLFIQSINVAKNNGMKVPRNYVLLGKSLLTLESVCGILDPEFDIVTASQTYVRKMILKNYSPENVAKKGKEKTIKMLALLKEIPEIANKYVEKQQKRDAEFHELHQEIKFLEKEITTLMDRVITIGAAFVLLLSAYLFKNTRPLYSDFSWISIILFITGMLLIAYGVLKKN